MQKTTAALLLTPVVAAGVLTWAWRSKPYTIQADNCAAITPAGRVRLAVLRQLLQRFGGATARRLGLPKLPVRAIEQHVVPTAHGPARVTFYWPQTTSSAPLAVYVNLHGAASCWAIRCRTTGCAVILPSTPNVWW
ncbi:hypothetical protein [Hymenobacter cellulosilyticus]|uniref:Ig-like domain-containing protein n=1 Tax=Hymenobacter cellulosilyticus TaxID=2932248 RepID=A0A8T9Q4W1_9BACT|nr:hypothetical protein [Hymenobacter cellulosilyticus]UOQ70918.1 hypothetical protein MUN79_19885 [Hymenobacter cellulosilyticus]